MQNQNLKGPGVDLSMTTAVKCEAEVVRTNVSVKYT